MFDDPAFLAKLAGLEKRYHEVSALLGQPEIISNRNEFTKLAKEHADLSDLVTAWQAYLKNKSEQVGAAEMVAAAGDDPEMRELAKEELGELQTSQAEIEQSIKVLLLPKDPNDAKNILLEVRAGTGGDEGRPVCWRHLSDVLALRRA